MQTDRQADRHGDGNRLFVAILLSRIKLICTNIYVISVFCFLLRNIKYARNVSLHAYETDCERCLKRFC
jgi:hypothetical protein